MTTDEMGTIQKLIVLAANLIILLLIVIRQVTEMKRAYDECDERTERET